MDIFRKGDLEHRTAMKDVSNIMGTPGHFRGGGGIFLMEATRHLFTDLTFKQLKTVFTEGFRVFKIEEFFKSNLLFDITIRGISFYYYYYYSESSLKIPGNREDILLALTSEKKAYKYYNTCFYP
jgi:hypothetical protein